MKAESRGDWAEPYRIKMVEPIQRTTREERVQHLDEAGWNPFALRAEHVFIDLLSDSGVGAMSDNQWAGLMRGDESYAGSRNFYHLQEAVQDILGFEYVLPCHQGRGAENVMYSALMKEKDAIPGNAHFDTTRAHIEHKKGVGVDCLIEEAFVPTDPHPFKGNIDINSSRATIEQYGVQRVPFVLVTVTCNSAGGQPVSLENLRDVRKLTAEFDIRLFLDIARYGENAYFIQQREKGYHDKTIREIITEMMSLADGVAMSAKKDAIVNMGGFLAFREKELYEQCTTYGILFEGFPTYGGLAGRDLEAIARGLYEGLEQDYLESRIHQIEHLGDRLHEADVPHIRPVGGHAVFVDAGAFLPHVPREQFPGHALACHLYLEAGVRGVEIGTLMNGPDPETGEPRFARLELMRLTIPRRVYTYNHMDYVADGLIRLYDRREELVGVRFTEEAPILRHFTSKFEPVS